MTVLEGGFYSALDADSEGEEGKFYVWTPDEMHEVLGEEASADEAIAWYGVTQRATSREAIFIVQPRGHSAISASMKVSAELSTHKAAPSRTPRASG